MGAHRIMIRVLMFLLWTTSIGAAVDCTTVTDLISVCSNYISYGSPDPYPGSPCCEAVTNLNLMTHSTDNRRSLCGCFMSLITANNVNSTAIATLPGFCGVPLGFTIDPDINCDSYIFQSLTKVIEFLDGKYTSEAMWSYEEKVCTHHSAGTFLQDLNVETLRNSPGRLTTFPSSLSI